MTIEKQILSTATQLGTFTVAEIQNGLGGAMNLDRSRLNWYLSKLEEEGNIVRIARGTYSAKDIKKQFTPSLSEEASALYRQFYYDFPEINLCVYEGTWLFQFMHHLASNQMTYIEIEKELAEIVFHRLQDEGKTVYLRPDSDLIYKYVNMDRGGIIVKHLTTESPLQNISGIKVPTLEKLLVDMYCDPDFFYLQESEYYRIMHNAYNRYVINQSRLLRYARRRNVADKIKSIYNNSLYDID